MRPVTILAVLPAKLRHFHAINVMHRMQSLAWQQPLTLLAAFAWLGVLLDRSTELPQSLWLSLLVCSAIGLPICSRLPPPDLNRLRIPIIGMLIISLFALRHHNVTSQYAAATVFDVLQDQAEPMILTGVVDRPARMQRDPLDVAASWRDDAASGLRGTSKFQTILQVSIRTLRIGFQPEPFTGRALVRVDGDCVSLLPGDHVKLMGQISLFTPPTNPGERDMREWAARNDLQCTLQVDSLEGVSRPDSTEAGQRYTIWQRGGRIVASLAASARESILQQIAPDQQGLALALVLGQRDLLDRTTAESLLVTGTAHLLSVSGLHLGILLVLARIIAGLLRFPLKLQWVFLVGVTLFYVAITGGRPPVLRAAILLSTVVLSTAMARPQQPINSLSLAAIVLAGWMPAAIFSVGMQLSFLAVATLLSCGRPRSRGHTLASQSIELEHQFDELARQSLGRLRRYLQWSSRGLMIAVWYSGCVSVITLPIVWNQFHVVSPISVLVNVVLSPLMLVALSAGVSTVLAAGVFTPLAVIPGWVCSEVLTVMRWVIEQASKVPGGHAWLPSPSVLWVAMFYAVLLLIVAARACNHRRVPIVLWSIAWFATAWWTATTPSALPAGTYEATFVDVGHGTATILRPRSDDIWLYDCGWLGNFHQSSQKVDDVLWSMGVTRLQGIVISHADADHFNALPGLAKRFSIGCIITPPDMLSGDGAMLARTRRVIQEYDIPVYEIDRDGSLAKRLKLAEPPFWLRDVHVLHPPAVPLDASDNANSLVLQIDHGGRYLLLPGDLEPPGTAVLISTPRPRPGGVMMAPHHGSLRMDAGAVLQWARPRETIVSGGKRAAKPAVTQMLSAAGGGVHVTADDGAIRVRMDAAGNVEIRSWLGDPW
ncbi:ComEC/Rec2 family competence protein [Allorhodopirellula heiligendammensis]|uniref:ComEC family competence protein n=1 Tax=Allorhodopirellula heiligendammensis TaxID=2714739 RepID=A0A5C6BZW1_9BACT|nr:ComEC/Rec2 family competence protein [Allorhodopirellula heiligendammensis]TWU16474.1 ComEC family competence protein [Allorhodopirellula heiligendammensis]